MTTSKTKSKSKAKSTRGAGRPPKYTEQDFIAICERIGAGELLIEICKEDGQPTRQTFAAAALNKEKYPELFTAYARAREIRADGWFEECISIADDARFDWEVRQEKGKASIVCDHEHVQRSRLRVDTRKWAAAKVLPERYGKPREEAGQNRGAQQPEFPRAQFVRGKEIKRNKRGGDE